MPHVEARSPLSMNLPARYDESWKEALDVYFPELLAFFFPALHALIDWQRPLESLDTQFQQLIPAADVGNRIADKLVKVWTLLGAETLILVHVEVQSQYDQDFTERMYVYHYRIFDFYHRPVVSLAILGDESPTWRPCDYGYGVAGSSIRLQFPSIKLLDYLEQWQELESSSNPIAVLVMAHLRTKATVREPSERKRWKWVLIRRLYEQGWGREDIEQILRMLDWMMTLPPELERQFREELDTYEEERKMPLITSMERLAKEEGIQQTTREIATKLLKEGADLDLIARVTDLTMEEIEDLRSEASE